MEMATMMVNDQDQQQIISPELTPTEHQGGSTNGDASPQNNSQNHQEEVSPSQSQQMVVLNGNNKGGEVHILDGFKQQNNNNHRAGPPPPPRPPKSISDHHLHAAQIQAANIKSDVPRQTQQQGQQSTQSPTQMPAEPFTLKLGFVNSATGRYLTAEKFNNRLNVLGTALKARQQWTLECPDPSTLPGAPVDIVHLKSASGFYLAANIKGQVTCESTERTPETQFVIEFERSASPTCLDDENGDNNSHSSSPSSFTVGRWAVRSVQSGAYLGVWSQQKQNKRQDEQLDSVQCRVDRTNLVSDSELWHAQLCTMPLVHLKNFGRGNRYAHLNNDGEAFLCNDVIPWGKRSLILLEFYDGKYAIRSAANNKYLHREGGLVPCLSRDTLFSLEFKTCVGLQQFNGVVFRDVTGACLCASGVGMVRSSIRKTITKDEIFNITESHPQVTITNVANNKYVSIKQGMDVSANQAALVPDDDSSPDFVPYSNNEVFQVELDRFSKMPSWVILTSKNKLWQINAKGAKSSGVTACGEDRLAPDAQFEAQWLEADGTLSLKSAVNGCFIKANPTGALQAITNPQQALTDREKFYLDIINRPLAVFRGSFGFIGLLTGNNVTSNKGVSLRLDCSRVTHDVFELVQRGPGTYAIRAVNGKYWRVVDGDLSVNADCDEITAASWFRFEFHRYGRVTIRHVQNPSGAGLLYLSGEQSGIVAAKGREVNDSTLWEM